MTPAGTGSLNDDARKVMIDGKPVFKVDSVVSSCTGNEAGTQKEVVSLKTEIELLHPRRQSRRQGRRQSRRLHG